MSFYPRRTLLRALIVSLLAHTGLLFGVDGIFPMRVAAPPLVLQVAMSRGGGIAGDAPVASGAGKTLGAPVSLPPAGREAPALPLDTPPAPVDKTPPIPAPVITRSSARDDAPVRPRAPRTVTRKKPAVSDSHTEEVTHPAPPSSTVAAEVSTSLPATLPTAGNSSDGGSPGGESPGGGSLGSGSPGGAETAAPFGTAPARRDDACTGDDILRYRSALGKQARRLRRYPPLAREQGWEGSAEITLRFRREDAAPTLSLTASSGYDILDEQALETLRQAIRRTERPAGLKGGNCRMRQTVIFSLEDSED
ncbi:MAG: TonB family protein [Candidatus Accumulibacter sp.]|jgi:protein TonB|nr:TonB family protein [Accumulibacter sp.]